MRRVVTGGAGSLGERKGETERGKGTLQRHIYAYTFSKQGIEGVGEENGADLGHCV